MTMPIHNKSDIYDEKPLQVLRSIPVFSKRDAYMDNYDKIAADHISKITEFQENPFIEEELWVSLERQTREIIRKYVPKGQRILDVGVGLGRLLEPLTEYERYGVDISLDYLIIAKSRGIEVALAKVEDLPYAKGSFDAIVACDVLEHVFDLNYCCRKIIECLRPGGILIVRVPYKEDLDVYLNDDLSYEFIHIRNFDEAGLRLLFQKIFRLEFVESATSTPYLQGASRLKFRPLQETARSRLSSLAQIQTELSEVASAFEISEEKFVEWIYQLKSTAPEVYQAVLTDLIHGIEIDCVFRKPFDHVMGDYWRPESGLAFHAERLEWIEQPWREFCGSHLAKVIGITDSSPESLKRFDDWYFDTYPYLFTHIPFERMKGKKVLEVGLGYGTIAQRLAEAGTDYTGLDIACGPVSMANHRLVQCGLPGKAVQGSILNHQLPADTFDYVIAIGCLHHTGNLQMAIQQCFQVLKPGGQLIFMVHYAYSYRRFRMTPLLTLKTLVKEALGYRGVVGNGSDRQRAAYDAGPEGGGAPHTDWISERSLRHYCRDFSAFRARVENIDQEPPFIRAPRSELLKTRWPALVGLDIYATAIK